MRERGAALIGVALLAASNVGSLPIGATARAVMGRRGKANAAAGAGRRVLRDALLGPESVDAAAGMNHLAMAAAFIRENMPYEIDFRRPVLSVQQARILPPS